MFPKIILTRFSFKFVNILSSFLLKFSRIPEGSWHFKIIIESIEELLNDFGVNYEKIKSISAKRHLQLQSSEEVVINNQKTFQ